MKGTALLMNKDQTVTVLENVDHEVYEELANQEDEKDIQCKIDDKEVKFDPVTKVVWCEDTIDWDYGY